MRSSPLWNKDLAPTTPAQQTWTTWNIAAILKSIDTYAGFVTFTIGSVMYYALMFGRVSKEVVAADGRR